MSPVPQAPNGGNLEHLSAPTRLIQRPRTPDQLAAMRDSYLVTRQETRRNQTRASGDHATARYYNAINEQRLLSEETGYLEAQRDTFDANGITPVNDHELTNAINRTDRDQNSPANTYLVQRRSQGRTDDDLLRVLGQREEKREILRLATSLKHQRAIHMTPQAQKILAWIEKYRASGQTIDHLLDQTRDVLAKITENEPALLYADVRARLDEIRMEQYKLMQIRDVMERRHAASGIAHVRQQLVDAEQISQPYEAGGASIASIRKTEATKEDLPYTDASKETIAVVDGMGGLQKGRFTGRDAAEATRDGIAEALSMLPANKTVEQVVHVLRVGWEKARDKMPVDGIGAAAAVACVVDKQIVTAHSGDARVGIVKKDGTLRYVTRDHSRIPQHILDAFDQAQSWQQISMYENEWNNKNIITRYISKNRQETPEIGVHNLEHDDAIVVCESDGPYENIGKKRQQELFKWAIDNNISMLQLARVIAQEATDQSRLHTSDNFRAKPDDCTVTLLRLRQ